MPKKNVPPKMAAEERPYYYAEVNAGEASMRVYSKFTSRFAGEPKIEWEIDVHPSGSITITCFNLDKRLAVLPEMNNEIQLIIVDG